MTAINHASTTAGSNTPVAGHLARDRKIAIVAMHAARHMGCGAISPLRALLVDLLMQDGHDEDCASDAAANLIAAADYVLISLQYGETRKIPWRGGPDIGEYAEDMYRWERGL